MIVRKNFTHALLELCPQRYSFIEREVASMKSEQEAIHNEYYLTLFLRKKYPYEIKLIDASNGELAFRLHKTINGEPNIIREKNKGIDIGYYSAQYMFQYNLLTRLQGNLAKVYPKKFKAFYDVFINQRDDIMKEKIEKTINTLSESDTEANCLVLVGNYHFNALSDYLDSLDV